MPLHGLYESTPQFIANLYELARISGCGRHLFFVNRGALERRRIPPGPASTPSGSVKCLLVTRCHFKCLGEAHDGATGSLKMSHARSHMRPGPERTPSPDCEAHARDHPNLRREIRARQYPLGRAGDAADVWPAGVLRRGKPPSAAAALRIADDAGVAGARQSAGIRRTHDAAHAAGVGVFAHLHLHLCHACRQEPACRSPAGAAARYPAIGADPRLHFGDGRVLHVARARPRAGRRICGDLRDLHQPGLEHGLQLLPVACAPCRWN